jgi:hypothetical protein
MKLVATSLPGTEQRKLTTRLSIASFYKRSELLHICCGAGEE